MNCVKKIIAAAFCVALVTSAFADPPDVFVEYVQSDCTQYIDTGIKGRCGTSANDFLVRGCYLGIRFRRRKLQD